MKINKYTFPILFAIVCTTASAQTTSYPIATACLDQATSFEQQQICYKAEISRQKKRLNAAYDRLIKNRDPRTLEMLNQSQKDWIKWRDENYKFIYDGVAGQAITIQIIGEGFMIDTIAKQADLLESIADAEAR